MIRKKICFILGAGASADLDIPCNNGLVNSILNRMQERDILLKELEDVGFENANNLVQEFYEGLLYGAINSIDEFLGYRPEFINLGKYLITRELAQYESDNIFLQTEKNNQSKKIWHKTFINLLRETSSINLSSHLSDPLDICKEYFSNISFITFNYERTFEYFLFKSICTAHGFNHPDKQKTIKNYFINKLNLVHAFGQIGSRNFTSEELPWGYLKEKSIDFRQLKKASENIKIIKELYDEPSFNPTEDTEKIQKYINEAEQIVFLGFGFNSYALRFLELSTVRKRGVDPFETKIPIPFQDKRCIGTSFLMNERETDIAKKHFEDRLKTTIELNNLNIGDFLNNLIFSDKDRYK